MDYSHGLSIMVPIVRHTVCLPGQLLYRPTRFILFVKYTNCGWGHLFGRLNERDGLSGGEGTRTEVSHIHPIYPPQLQWLNSSKHIQTWKRGPETSLLYAEMAHLATKGPPLSPLQESALLSPAQNLGWNFKCHSLLLRFSLTLQNQNVTCGKKILIITLISGDILVSLHFRVEDGRPSEPSAVACQVCLVVQILTCLVHGNFNVQQFWGASMGGLEQKLLISQHWVRGCVNSASRSYVLGYVYGMKTLLMLLYPPC